MFTYRKITFFFIIISCLAILGCSETVEKKNFPVFLQQTSKDCGSACLKMITDYYDIDKDLDELKRISSFDQEIGTTLLGLSEALDSLGMENLGVHISYEDLLYDTPLPAIVHWKGNHFVVVYKMSSNKVWVADPAIGTIEYSRDEFSINWLNGIKEKISKLGVALIFEPPLQLN